MLLRPSQGRRHPHPSVFNVQNSGVLLSSVIEEEILGHSGIDQAGKTGGITKKGHQ